MPASNQGYPANLGYFARDALPQGRTRMDASENAGIMKRYVKARERHGQDGTVALRAGGILRESGR
jgi:hypothetical protein